MIDELDDSVTGQHVRVTVTSVDDSGPQQVVAGTGYDGQSIGEAVRLQHFGATSVPPVGSQGLMLLSGGRHDRPHFVGLEHPDHRPTNNPSGTKVLYDDKGNVIRMYGDDGIQVAAKKGNVTFTPEPGKFVFLGGDGTDGTYGFVMTDQGPSTVVKAKL